MRALFPILLAAAGAACGGGASGSGSDDNPPPPPTSPTPIYDVQGAGAESPLTGQAVTVQGIVTGDFQDGDADDARNLGGFFVQGVPDGDFETSDGVFVFDGPNPAVDVAPGDSVRVSGTVNEYFGETQISASSVAVVGAGSLVPAFVNLPSAGTTSNADGQLIADLERYEGMLVRFPQTLSVSGLWSLEEHGDVLLSEGGVPPAFTNANAPDAVGFAAHVSSVASRRIILDDGQRAEDVTPVHYLDAGGASIRIGDQVTDLVGNLRYSRGSGSRGVEGYRLMPTETVQLDPVNPRPGAPVLDGALRVATVNARNLFSRIDTGPDVCGPNADLDCRGANSAEELDRQVGKLASAVAATDADIIGIIEIENNADASLQLIIDAVNASLGAGTYDYVDAGTIGTDAIKVGFLYRPGDVGPVGPPAILDAGVDVRFNDQRNRPVLAQTFSLSTNGARLTVAVAHLKSKGSPCDSDGDPDTGDGQSNCNLTRTHAALAIADWLASDPTGSGDPDALLIGDLNAYLFEDPVAALKTAGFVSLLEERVGTGAYSFLFDGQRGALDHALASPSLALQVASVTEWPINADEPPLLDYNLEPPRDPGLFDASTPYRASDHDPLIVGLDLVP
jgi:predicted extracellular nuclease